MRAVATLTLLTTLGCGFKGNGKTGDPDAPVVLPPLDVPPTLIDARPDAPPAPQLLFAASNTELYKVDLDHPATPPVLVDTIKKQGVALTSLDGLGFDGANLIGLDTNGSALLVIDPATAVVTASKPLQLVGLAGLTVIPAHDNGTADPIFLAASGTTLYQILPQTGMVVPVGTFSTGLSFSTDLAWVHGHGLFVTVIDAAAAYHAVQINPTTARTIAELGTGFDNINGLSGYRDSLWAVSNGGNVYAVDMTTGATTLALSGGPMFTEAAQ